MDGSADANAKAAKSKELNLRLGDAKKRLAEIKKLPYRDSARIATVEAQIARTQAAINKLADPVGRQSFTQNISGTDSKVGPNTRGDQGPAEYNKNLKKTLAERKAKRLQILKGGSADTAKYQREKYYGAKPEKPGMAGSYKLDEKTGKWVKK